jgi:hypothetical protein
MRPASKVTAGTVRCASLQLLDARFGRYIFSITQPTVAAQLPVGYFIRAARRRGTPTKC